MHERPNEYEIPWTVHGAIFAYGIGLLDNSLIEPLSKECTRVNKFEFMLSVNPLKIVGVQVLQLIQLLFCKKNF